MNSTDDNNATQKNSEILEDISAIKINNGLPNPENNNNILIFPSIERYKETVEYLEQIVETNYTSFETGIDPELTDEEYEELMVSEGFDSDQPLLDFENYYYFSSLRKNVNEAHLAWLSEQGDDEWDAYEDPDSHHVFDQEERTLLNIGSEVVIGTDEENFQIYKYYDDNTLVIFTEYDLDLLKDFNTNPLPYLGNPNGTPGLVFMFYDIDENAGGTGSSGSTGSGCKSKNDIRKYFSTGSNTKIKTVSKFQPLNGITESNVKAKTKYYRKKLGVWTKGVTTLTAKLETTEGIFDCGGNLKPSPKEKTRKRHKVKVKWDQINLLLNDPKIMDNKTYSTHKRRDDIVKVIDLYDGQVH